MLQSGLRVLACGVVLWSTQPLWADLDTTPKVKRKPAGTGSNQPTALADVASASVDRAGEVVIRLHGIASGGGQLEFSFLQKPAHGRIIRSKTVGLDSVDVTYRHSGDLKSDQDSFVFGVRSAAGGPFSPGQAKITITTSPSRLLVPDALTFPATLTGQTASDSFVVVNEGGEILSGKITISEPWHLVQAATYQLKPREKHKIDVLFTPKTNGPCEGRLIFEGTKPAFINLQGEGLGTFLASPAKLVLTPALDGKRRGVVTLQNNSPEPITIEVASSLGLPKSVALQFGETRELPIEDSGSGVLATSIVFKAGTYASRVEVSASGLRPAQP